MIIANDNNHNNNKYNPLTNKRFVKLKANNNTYLLHPKYEGINITLSSNQRKHSGH